MISTHQQASRHTGIALGLHVLGRRGEGWVETHIHNSSQLSRDCHQVSMQFFFVLTIVIKGSVFISGVSFKRGATIES